jgi:hypothetical protein
MPASKSIRKSISLLCTHPEASPSGLSEEGAERIKRGERRGMEGVGVEEGWLLLLEDRKVMELAPVLYI